MIKGDLRVLVISHNCFSKVNNNGKTLESIMSGFKKKNISQIYFSNIEPPDWDFCNSYFKVTDKDVLISTITNSKICGQKLSKEKDRFHQDNKTNIYDKTVSNFKPFFIILRDTLWNFQKWKNKELKAWSIKQNPHFVFFVGGNYTFSHNFADYIANLIDIPLITYFTDDYVIYPEPKNLFDIIQQKKLKKCYLKTIANSTLLFAIGELMAKEYSVYFQREFHPIMNSVSRTKFDYYNGFKDIEKETISIAYFGGLHLNRWKMISFLSSIINTNKNLFSKTPDIYIYTNSKITSDIKRNFKKNGIIVKKPLVGDELIKKMIDTDILLHVESDDKYNKSLTKLSVSTKIPEYLLTRNCVLAYGPSEVASIKLLQDNNIGIVIDSKESEKSILKKLSSLIENKEKRKEIGNNGYEYAKENFDTKTITSFFTKKIEELIENIHKS